MENNELNNYSNPQNFGFETTKNEPQKGKPKRGKKKILMLLFLLVMTAVVLATSTYAWFTSNRTVTVENIDVNVAASGGIQISVDGTNWKTIVTTNDLKNAHTTYSAATNQLPTTLKPVSTAAASLNNGYLSMWLGTVSASQTTTNLGQYILSTTDISTVADNSENPAVANRGTNGAFVMFDLFLRLDDSSAPATNPPEQMLYLTTASDVVIQQGSTNLGTKNAARVAFIKEGNMATGSALSDIQGLSTANASNIYLWEPNFDAHTSTGLSNAYSYYNSTNSGAQYAKATAGNQITYYGTTGAIAVSDDVLLSKANPTDTEGKFAAVTAGIKTAEGWTSGTDYQELFGLVPNNITKVRIYFWIEGQDIDCENNASGGLISLKLQFSLNDSSSSTNS